MLDIIAPVYNEAENIEHLFVEIASKIKVAKRVLLVYDSDEDDTLPVVALIKEQYDFPIELKKNHYGKGVLNAIKTGLDTATAEAVLVTMADLSDDLGKVDEMYHLAQNGHDLVCGSRYMKGGKQLGGPLLKKTLSRIAGVSLHYVTGIPTHDVTNSFKLYTRCLFDAFRIESTGGFELGMELTVKAYVNGYRIAEIPTTWNDRTAGTSNFKMWNWIPRYLHWYFFCVRHSWFSKKSIHAHS